MELRREEGGYPAGLLALDDPPSRLFVRGMPPPDVRRAVAVVGSRAATPYGLSVAGRLAGDLSRMGFVVVSGLARGIDAAAHRGALAAGGPTIAVLPSGLDTITPDHHRELADRIAARGGLVTEHESGGPGHRGAFVRRNRLIAALSAATVVVEAADRSGALSTAFVAKRIGRPRLAVPGDIDSETSRGCHRLIREGATLCTSAGDVARAIGVWSLERAPSPVVPAAEPAAARLLATLDREPRPVEAIAAASGLTIAEALGELLALEWAGGARAFPGQRWSRAE